MARRDANAVIIRNNDVPRVDERTGAHHGKIDVPQCFLDSSWRGKHQFRPVRAAVVELSSFVEIDLDVIAERIETDNSARAVSFIREIRSKFAVIGHNPAIYQLRPEIGDDARMAVVGRYVILFCISENIARMERVADGAPDLFSLFSGER